MVNAESGNHAPLIGVLISAAQSHNLLKQRPHRRLLALAKANLTAETCLYFFSLKHIDINKRVIYGIIYDHDTNKWEVNLYPYPSVLYKRSDDTKYKSKKYEAFKHQLNELEVRYINYQSGFSKWELYNQLIKCQALRQYLPETRLLSSIDDLKVMLENHDVLYVKASRGRRGENIIRIAKQPNGAFKYSYFKDRVHVRTARCVNSMYNYLTRFFGLKEIIIQQAIDLLKMNGSFYDLRAEIQRDGNGKLTIVGVPVRLARKNSPITTHADSYTFDYFFNTYMNLSSEETNVLKNKVISFVRDVYECVEKNYGPTGELGIDFALDHQWRLWYIETNSQSAKVSLMKAYDKQTIKQAFLNPLEYGKYLHNQT
ncbi:hypothetical protein CR194_10080 [Salipaludibacillus keqinensis]|uniref:ATP-grasp domain-containing protein n=1 Tax=Salipaludibacillus keqinensis TaxID=2045207 RepID=A0A323TES9_9BACI|nr:YheC/YheD family protein [Salipaludibacillus keqinensis]PYZ93508.1 hypothetical protein CR194_10080 [Salipaludibacillus keqinensis]